MFSQSADLILKPNIEIPRVLKKLYKTLLQYFGVVTKIGASEELGLRIRHVPTTVAITLH